MIGSDPRANKLAFLRLSPIVFLRSVLGVLVSGLARSAWKLQRQRISWRNVKMCGNDENNEKKLILESKLKFYFFWKFCI